MRIKRSLVAAAILALGIGGWLASGELGLGPGEPAPSPSVTARLDEPRELQRVRVREVRAQERVRDIVLQGETRPSRQVVLRAETTGRVVELPVREGSRVEEGQVLARLSLEDREARLAEARAQLERRQLEYDQARQLQREDFASRTRVAEAKAELDAARARLAATEVDLRRTVIRAPFSGVLETLAVELGDYLAPGGEVATILDLAPLVVAGEVTERDVAMLSPGGEAWARLLGDVRLEGRITYIAARAKPGTRTYPVEVTVENPQDRVLAGLTAEMHLPTRSMKAHLVSPSVLTLDDDGQIGVKTVDAGGIVHFNAVAILGDDAEGVWVGGLPETARVITVGQEFVADGQKVEPVREQTAEAG